MSIPTLLDHVVIAGPDLVGVVDWFRDRTGVTAAPGGAHPTGTANALVALKVSGVRGPQYIELIGPDPDRAASELPSTFGIDTLAGPRIQTYAVHPVDIDATVAAARCRGYDPGEVRDLSRRTPAGELLQWRLTRGESHRLDVPFLIDWGATTHPGVSDIPAIELVSFTRVEPDPDPLLAVLQALGLGEGAAAVQEGAEPRFRLTLRRDDGRLVEL